MTGDHDAMRERMEAQVAPGGSGGWDDVRRRVGRRPWRPGALFAVPAIAIAVGGTAAATGFPSLGDVIHGRGFGDGGTEVRETVLARGFSPQVGHWQVLSFRGRGGTSCLKAKLADPRRGAEGRGDGGYCADHDTLRRFEAYAIGSQRQAAKRGSVVIFGPAPRRARSVVLSSEGRAPQIVATQHPPGRSSSYWFVAAPPGPRHATVSWRGAAGSSGESLDVSSRFDRPASRATVLEGEAPVAGRWRLSVTESRRLVDRDSIAEPEGLPCIQLHLPHPPRGTLASSGGCGELRQAPGFFKLEQRVPSTLGRAREVLLFGRAPAAATRVELLNGGGGVATTPAHLGRRSIRGRFWLLAVPGKRAHGSVRWVGRERRGPPVRVFGPD